MKMEGEMKEDTLLHYGELTDHKKAKRYESLFKGNYRGNNNTRVLGSKG